MRKVLKWLGIALGFALLLRIATTVYGRWVMNRLVQKDVEALLAMADTEPAGIVTEEVLEGLPEPVWRYLVYTGVVGKPRLRTVHLRQQGKMRASAAMPWMDLEAEQWFTVRPPGFVWDGSMRMGPVALARARDEYLNGHGNMLIRAWELLPIAHASGPEMDQGALMRYLSEMIWFPTAFLEENVTFEAVDDHSARVTLTDHGQSVSGTMYFDDEGRVTEFVAKRYRAVENSYSYDTWSASVTEYGEIAGLRLPVRAKAVWKLPEGDLEYIEPVITEIDYNGERWF